jgi:iron(III) transport system permease protein
MGVYFGYRLGSRLWPGRSAWIAFLVLPIAIPPYVLALGWTLLFRTGGPLGRSLSALGADGPRITEFIYSFGGAVVVLSLAFFPIAFAFSAKACSMASPALLETAQVFGAGRRQAFLAVYWPFIRPSAAASAVIVFLLAIAELGVPTLLKVRVFNFEVFTQLSAFNNVNAALLLTLPLVMCGLVGAGLLQRVLAEQVRRDIQDIERPPLASRNDTIVNAALAGTLATLTFALPVGAVVSTGLNAAALSKMMRLAFQPALNTLWYAGLAAAGMVGLAFLLAWTLREGHERLKRLTRAMLMAGFAIPGTIVALALLSVYGNAPLSRWFPATVLVVAALCMRYQILAFEIMSTSLGELPKELFDAAVLDGAGIGTLMWRIVLPWLRTPVLFALALSFLFATNEIGSTLLLYPPGGETLPIALFSIEANSPRAYVSALAILQTLLCSVPVILMMGVLWFHERRERN